MLGNLIQQTVNALTIGSIYALIALGYTMVYGVLRMINFAHGEMFMLGENRALDPGKYFIILTNLLANGLSSSPSNSPAPVERGRFPKVTIHDNVRLQHQLITEKLGIERLRLVTGFSMGACQAFQWAAQFPDMVRAACPIAVVAIRWT